MVSVSSLLETPATDVTFERVAALVATAQMESLTLEFKIKYSPGVIETVAAMANSYGGVILIGVADRPGPDRIVGVDEGTRDQVANACHDSLEPPWQPEILTVAIPEQPERFVLVLRVHPDRAPRPLLIKGAAKIRLHGRNAIADRSRLAGLFAEAREVSQQTRPFLDRAQLPRDGVSSPLAEFMLRSGVVVPVGPSATWRPLSDRMLESLAVALSTAPLEEQLRAWLSYLKEDTFRSFHREGFNRARRAQLVWTGGQDDPAPAPVRALAQVGLPETVGAPVSMMSVTLDILIRGRTLQQLADQGQEGGQWLAVADLYRLIEALVLTLLDPAVVQALADLAGVEPERVPQPASLDLVTATDVVDLLAARLLRPIPDAGSSHGANLWSDPSLDLRDPGERRTQLDLWLAQIGADAGLQGMENVLEQFHQGSH